MTIKYLQCGHIYMKADSVHGMIGNKMKKTEIISNFQDNVNLCSSCSQTVVPIQMDSDDFFDFVPGNRARQSQNVIFSIPQRYLRGSV